MQKYEDGRVSFTDEELETKEGLLALIEQLGLNGFVQISASGNMPCFLEYDNGSFALGKSLSFIPEEFVEFLKSVPDGTKGFRSYLGSDKFLHIASIDDTNFGNLYIELHL